MRVLVAALCAAIVVHALVLFVAVSTFPAEGIGARVGPRGRVMSSSTADASRWRREASSSASVRPIATAVSAAVRLVCVATVPQTAAPNACPPWKTSR